MVSDTVAAEKIDISAADTSGGGSYRASSEPPADYIRFYGSKQDETRNALETFAPFAPVAKLAQQYIHLQDSLEALRQLYGQPLTDREDTLFLRPFKQKAYQAILDYKKLMASGKALEDRVPTLLDLTRITEPGDSSFSLLPEAGPSDFLSKGNFFFMGGAPVISKVYSDGNNILTDPQGRPETRFGTSLTENASYLFTSVYHAKPGAIDIEYGPPLYTYEMGPNEVYGIGSLIHKFVQRVPALFITEEGLLPAHLVSVKLNLADEYNCGAGSTYIEFACAKSIEAESILGVFIPYGVPPASCAFNRLSDSVWTADLNNDGSADLACVSEGFPSRDSYYIAELLWFVNIDGTWKIIEWAIEPECT